MNEAPTDNQTSGRGQIDETRADAKHAVTVKTKFWTVLFNLLLVATLLTAAGALYLAWQNRDADFSARTTLDKVVKKSEMQGARLGELEAQLDELRETQEAASRSLQDLLRELPGGNEDWALAEVEFLLIIATHHLQLEHNPDAALNAMQAADLRLRGLANPALNPVREQLAMDITRLKELNSTDTTSLALMLGDLATRINSLPLAGGTQKDADVTQAQHEPPKGILGSILEELRRLVIIRHDDEKRQASLLPGREYFVYQNLRLELESARLSLLRRDTENLHISADAAQKWLTEYFDTTDPAVVNVVASLQQLSSINLDATIPDISSTLESLRAYMREKAAPPPGAESRGPQT